MMWCGIKYFIPTCVLLYLVKVKRHFAAVYSKIYIILALAYHRKENKCQAFSRLIIFQSRPIPR